MFYGVYLIRGLASILLKILFIFSGILCVVLTILLPWCVLSLLLLKSISVLLMFVLVVVPVSLVISSVAVPLVIVVVVVLVLVILIAVPVLLRISFVPVVRGESLLAILILSKSVVIRSLVCHHWDQAF